MPTLAENREILRNVLSNIQAVRSSFPSVISGSSRPLQPRPQPQGSLSVPTMFTAAFETVDTLEKLIASQSTQDALSAAKNLPTAPASVARKRKRSDLETASQLSTKRPSVQRVDIPSTESWPKSVPSDPWPVDKNSLENYVRHINKQGVVKLHIWSRSRTTQPQNREALVKPAYLRVTVPTVLVAYIDMEELEQNHEKRLGVLMVTVFGPREKKKPHQTSDYVVFQKLTQFLASVVQAHPDVDLPTMVSLISSYTDLYRDGCVLCGDIWSAEGSIPPVHRVWGQHAPPGTDPSDALQEKWLPRHWMCKGKRMDTS